MFPVGSRPGAEQGGGDSQFYQFKDMLKSQKSRQAVLIVMSLLVLYGLGVGFASEQHGSAKGLGFVTEHPDAVRPVVAGQAGFAL